MPITIRRATDGTEEDSAPIEIAISSETPIRRFDWLEWDVVEEILDHSSVDLSRAKDGLPLLLDHNARQQIGLVTDLRVDKDRVLRGTVQFGAHPDAAWVEKDMRSGIRRQVSVGAQFDQAKRTLVEERKEGANLYRVRGWAPMEASSVAMAADISVGVGRSAARVGPRPLETSPEPAPEARRHTVDEDQTTTGAAPKGAVDVEQIRRETQAAIRVETERAATAERERVQELIALANEHGLGQNVQRWVNAGLSVQQAKDEVTDLKRQNLLPVNGSPLVTLNDKEKKRYSLARAILAQDPESRDISDGLEVDISQQLERDGFQSRRGGLLVPTSVIQLKRSLNSITATQGAEGVFSEYQGFVELLRNRAMLLQLGVRLISGLRENFTLVRQTGPATLTWRAENTAADTPGADTAESQVAFDTVVLSPKTAQATTGFTRQSLRRSVFMVDDVVERDLVRIHALGMDLAGIHGTGTTQPLGLYGIAGVNSVPMGGAIGFSAVVNMETAIVADNADIGEMAYLTTPEVRGAAKTTQKFSGTNGDPIWSGSVDAGEMNGYRAAASNQVAKTLGGGAEHGILFGVWPQALFGEWGVLELITDPYRLKKQGIIECTSFQMLDFNVEHAVAFAKGTGLTVS